MLPRATAAVFPVTAGGAFLSQTLNLTSTACPECDLLISVPDIRDGEQADVQFVLAARLLFNFIFLHHWRPGGIKKYLF